jgi:chromosome segregation ATPase
MTPDLIVKGGAIAASTGIGAWLQRLWNRKDKRQVETGAIQLSDRDELARIREEMRDEIAKYRDEIERFRERYEKLGREHSEILRKYGELQRDHASLETKYETLRKLVDKIRETQNERIKEEERFRKNHVAPALKPAPPKKAKKK